MLKKTRNAERAQTIIAEQEVVVRLDRLTRKAYISSSWPTMSKKLEKKYGPPIQKTTARGAARITSAVWELPLVTISFRRLRRSTTKSVDTLERERAA
jgi:hypothetical protein